MNPENRGINIGQGRSLQELSKEELMVKIEFVEKKFNIAQNQLTLLDNLREETEVRYNRAVKENRKSFRLLLRLKLVTLDGVRNAFYQYILGKADFLAILQNELFSRFGIFWQDVQDAEMEH